MTNTTRPEMDDSFPSESSAAAFGEYLKSRLGCDCAVSPLRTPSGEVTVWFRLGVPAKHTKRAEDLRHAWRAALSLVGKSEASL